MSEEILSDNAEKLKIINKNVPLWYILRTVNFILQTIINIEKRITKIEEQLCQY